MTKTRFSLCILFLLTLVPGFIQGDATRRAMSTLHIITPESQIKPGLTLTAVFTMPGPNSGVKAILTDEKEGEELVILGETEGIPIRDESGGTRRVWVCFFGLSSTLDAGAYRITVTGGTDIAPVTRSEEITVLPHEFPAETIPLSRDMTALRSEPDPRKREESLELYNLITSRGREDLYYPDTFIHPLDEYLWKSSPFGGRRIYEYSDGNKASSVHFGVDYSAPTGTPVKSPASGLVAMAKKRILTGYTAVIQHLPGVYSLYYHLETLTAGAGDYVEAGDLIGTVGATGLVTGSHLHWELRVSGVAVDPEFFLEFPLIDKERIFSIIR
ncbi:MAG: M23 family metallopeptidase [Spirochaetia bacterium]